MDYRRLLKKYMDVVLISEGVHFIPNERGCCYRGITDEEIDELNKIFDEICKEIKLNGSI